MFWVVGELDKDFLNFSCFVVNCSMKFFIDGYCNDKDIFKFGIILNFLYLFYYFNSFF